MTTEITIGSLDDLSINQDRTITKYDMRKIEDQIAAVQVDGYALLLIKEPSEEVQLAAVRKDGKAIKFIKKPSLKVQLAAQVGDWL